MESHSFIVLASRSPRRVELLKQLAADFTVLPADIDETPHPHEDPVSYVKRLALEKARAVYMVSDPNSTVIGADTTVDLNGIIFGQPVDDDDARRMLTLLSGSTHQVHTGVAVVSAAVEVVEVVSSDVTFVSVTPELLEWYIGTGESAGKAGSYAIQGHGSALVASSAGSMTNIIGLPLDETARLLGIPGPK
ncbi:MAG: Maf family protein [Ilumatobacteraceae bacterium]